MRCSSRYFTSSPAFISPSSPASRPRWVQNPFIGLWMFRDQVDCFVRGAGHTSVPIALWGVLKRMNHLERLIFFSARTISDWTRLDHLLIFEDVGIDHLQYLFLSAFLELHVYLYAKRDQIKAVQNRSVPVYLGPKRTMPHARFSNHEMATKMRTHGQRNQEQGMSKGKMGGRKTRCKKESQDRRLYQSSRGFGN